MTRERYSGAISKAATAQKEQLAAAPLDPSVRALGVVSLLNDFSK